MGGEPESRLVLLRFSGDISTKQRATRHQFVRRLVTNLRDALASEGAAPRVRLSRDRAVVELPPGASADPLARVFGVQSFSEVEARVPCALDPIVDTAAGLFRERVRGRRFAVRARRVGNKSKIPVTPREVEVELGRRLLPDSRGVDLEAPEIVVGVELLEEEAYLLRDRTPSPGGLPIGVEGRALALVSGGFDSPVAAWHMLRRGVALDYLFCNLGGDTHLLGALRVMRLLASRWHYGTQPRLFAVDFAPVVEELRARTTTRYWQVLLKRLMLRAGEQVMRETRASALVTGEAIGQVSSQTLQNLAAITRATGALVLRPIVGVNKEEIIRTAEHIGTAELSSLVGEYCDLVPSRPATQASFEAVEAEERAVDLGVLERAVAARRCFDLRAGEEPALGLPGIDVSEVPEGAVVLDLRPRSQFDTWHHPDAVRLDFAHALSAYASFDRGKRFLLYCDHGLLSAHLAELMRKAGLEAYHFPGGTRALRKQLRAG